MTQPYGDKERVVAYVSKMLNKAEQTYSMANAELLAVVTFTKYVCHFLLWKGFL